MTEIRTAIQYGNGQIADAYIPDGPGPFPYLIGVHGGGWQQGARAIYQHWSPFLAARGYGLLAIDYRLSVPGKPSYPDAVHDARAAVRFVKTEASLKADPERVALIGDSAGGHLALLAALAGDLPPFADPGVSTKVKAAIGVYGIYDLVRQWNHDQVYRPRDTITQQFLGAAPMDDRRVYFDASPISYATTANNATAVLLAYGDEDDIVDRGQSDDFLTALKQARFYARNAVLPGWGHYWMATSPEDPTTGSYQFAPKLLRFLAEKL